MKFLVCGCCKALLVKEEALDVITALDSLTVEEVLSRYKLNREELSVLILTQYVNLARGKLREYFLVLIESVKTKEFHVKAQRSLPVSLAVEELRNLGRDMELLMNPMMLTVKVREALNTLLYGTYLEGMQRIESSTGMNFLPDLNALKMIQEYNFSLITNFNKENVEKLRGIINRGLMSGTDLYTMQRELLEQIDVSEYRAEMITRTENLRAANVGYYDAAMQSKLKGEFMWVASEDNRTCPLCNKLDGQRIVKDDPKSVFHAVVGKLEFTGRFPPAHPNDRCNLKFIPYKNQTT